MTPQDDAALVAECRALFESERHEVLCGWSSAERERWIARPMNHILPTLFALAEETIAGRKTLATYEEHIKLRNRTDVHQLAEIEELRRRLARLEPVVEAARAYRSEYLKDQPCLLKGRFHREDCERCALDAALDAVAEKKP